MSKPITFRNPERIRATAKDVLDRMIDDQKNRIARLSLDQLNALRTFADANGRSWKRELNDAWMTGMYCRYNGVDDEGLLQQVRNTFGPSWLVKFSFDDVKTHHTKY